MENNHTMTSRKEDLQKLRKRLPGKYVKLVQEKLDTEYKARTIRAVLAGTRENMEILSALFSVAEDCETLNDKLSKDSQ